jgi:hypothetical protein
VDQFISVFDYHILHIDTEKSIKLAVWIENKGQFAIEGGVIYLTGGNRLYMCILLSPLLLSPLDE